ncbi:MAG: 2OG-Fe(II) oxygenase [Balneolia bacterium]|nr:2OG-Fe(II) oxygenase [Balneolia bacterium]
MKTIDESVLFEQIADEIAEKGWFVTDNFIDEALLKGLISEASAYWEEGEFNKAGIGTGTQLQFRPEIRTDKIHWLDEDRLTPLQQQYWDRIDQLRETLNRTLYLSARSFEAHFAVYPEGSFYKKHLDQHQEVQHRLITCILYLNSDWTDEDGGKLRMYHHPDNDEEFTEIMPVMGRFVCFRSDQVVHEVLPAGRERFSLTGWLRRESLL